jgi:L-asparaginase / beta-aspartyl-peptidase
MPLALIVHGGAGNIPQEEWELHLSGCERAVQIGWRILREGGCALDAVQAAIMTMEDDPAFDAGIGSVLNRDGVVEMDAGMMEGEHLNVGACAGVTRVKNPIRLARAILDSENTFMVANGAERFAAVQGLETLTPEAFVTERETRRWHEFLIHPPPAEELFQGGTVGCVAVDRSGRVCAGTSTGGRDFKMPGRVGDSPLIGCGFYADNRGGGASTTGWGEGITRLVLCKWAVDELARSREAEQVAREGVQILQQRVNGVGGIIVADRCGRVADWHNTWAMARAWITEGEERVVAKITD